MTHVATVSMHSAVFVAPLPVLEKNIKIGTRNLSQPEMSRTERFQIDFFSLPNAKCVVNAEQNPKDFFPKIAGVQNNLSFGTPAQL